MHRLGSYREGCGYGIDGNHNFDDSVAELTGCWMKLSRRKVEALKSSKQQRSIKLFSRVRVAGFGNRILSQDIKLSARMAATEKARDWLEGGARCCCHLYIPAVPPSSNDWSWLEQYDDRGHLCYCPKCKRPYAVTVRTGFVDTDSLASKMVMIATFRALNEAPATKVCFEHTWEGWGQMAAKNAMKRATRWAGGVYELDADGGSVHAKCGFSGASFGPATGPPPTESTWANWPCPQDPRFNRHPPGSLRNR